MIKKLVLLFVFVIVLFSAGCVGYYPPSRPLAMHSSHQLRGGHNYDSYSYVQEIFVGGMICKEHVFVKFKNGREVRNIRRTNCYPNPALRGWSRW